MSPNTFFYLAKNFKYYDRILVEIDIMGGFKNFLFFFEIIGPNRTKMSPNTFFYLVKKFKILWSDFGWDWYYERI